MACSDFSPQQEGHPPNTETNTDHCGLLAWVLYRYRPAGAVVPRGPPKSFGLWRVGRSLLSEPGNTTHSFWCFPVQDQGRRLGAWSAPGAGLTLVLPAEGTLLPFSHPTATNCPTRRESQGPCCSPLSSVGELAAARGWVPTNKSLGPGGLPSSKRDATRMLQRDGVALQGLRSSALPHALQPWKVPSPSGPVYPPLK